MYVRLGRSGVGTTRTETISKELLFQNILRSTAKEVKSKIKLEMKVSFVKRSTKYRQITAWE